jgi:hypothetical protein
VTRSEAEQRAEQLQAEHPDRASNRFFARESSGGDWEVAKVPVPEGLRRPKLTPTIQATPVPSPPDDPRTGHEQRAPGTSGGV